MSVYNDRCQRAQNLMEKQDIDWLFISASADLQYLTGYKSHPSERLTLLMLPQDGRPTIVMPRFERIKLEQKEYDVFYNVSTWRETENPIDVVKAYLDTDVRKIGIAEQMWSSFLLRIQNALPEATRFVSAASVMTRLRLRKDAAEIAALREVGRRLDKVFADVCHLEFAGRTELEVGYEIFWIVQRHGLNPTRANGVASGPNSSSPHHRSVDRKIQRGDAVWIELGMSGNYNGYYADKTRAVHVGPPSDEYVRVYEVVKEAQEATVRAVRPGIECQQLDLIARDIISDAGYGNYFPHRVGHGLGLEAHELPWIVENNRQAIEQGMVFSVEPGIYLPGKFGVRIEDIVTATDQGVENFYSSTKELVVVE